MACEGFSIYNLEATVYAKVNDGMLKLYLVKEGDDLDHLVDAFHEYNLTGFKTKVKMFDAKVPHTMAIYEKYNLDGKLNTLEDVESSKWTLTFSSAKVAASWLKLLLYWTKKEIRNTTYVGCEDNDYYKLATITNQTVDEQLVFQPSGEAIFGIDPLRTRRRRFRYKASGCNLWYANPVIATRTMLKTGRHTSVV